RACIVPPPRPPTPPTPSSSTAPAPSKISTLSLHDALPISYFRSRHERAAHRALHENRIACTRGAVMQRIKKGDEVVVISGRDKGKRGTVLRRVDAEHLVIEGINRVKKHQRPNPMKGVTGGIVDRDLPIHVSNIALFNPATKKADRAGIKQLDDGRKVREFKANGEPGDV